MEAISLQPVSMRHVEYYVSPKAAGREVTFENGAQLEVLPEGSVRLIGPENAFLVREFAVPKVVFADGSAPRWSFDKLTVAFNCAIVNYTAEGGRTLAWRFKVGNLNLDGRQYRGFAESVTVSSGAHKVRFSTPLEIGASARERRMTVAAGYRELSTVGSASAEWRPFADGQPFAYLAGAQGIYFGMPTGLEDLVLGVGGGGAQATETRQVAFSRSETETSFWWHWFSSEAESGNSAYLGCWQYVRQLLRRRYAFKEWPAQPGWASVMVEAPITDRTKLSALRTAQSQGRRVIAEGMSPLVLDGADLSAHDFTRSPFALVGGAWRAVCGVDVFTAAAYGAFPRSGGRLDAATAAKVEEALRLCVMPFIRVMPFGTVWLGKDGGAVFFTRAADEVEFALPKAWTIRGVEGARLRQVKAGTVLIVENHYFG